NACITAGHCLAGVCIGSATSCDDSDVCTVDACDASGGCLHTPRTCVAPKDPCQVARCDPTAGCVVEAASDGTSCGASDCSGANVCMAGTCQRVAVPDGYPCGDAMACRGRGTCSAGTCSVPPAGPLPEVWHTTLSPSFSFKGVTDAAGNLYWVECSNLEVLNPCSLVSRTADGTSRFRATALGLRVAEGSFHLVSHGRVAVAGPDGAITTFSAMTGERLWSRAGQSDLHLVELAADSLGDLVAAQMRDGESESWALHTFDAASGDEASIISLPTRVVGLVLDASDTRYVAYVRPLAESQVPIAPLLQLSAISPNGLKRWSVDVSGGPPVAVYGEDVLLKSGEVRSASTGAPRPGKHGEITHQAPAPLMSSTVRYRWQGTFGFAVAGYLGWQWLEGFTPGVEVERFSWSTVANSPQASEMQLLDDGTALFASSMHSLNDLGLQTDDVYLRSIDPNGVQKFACLVGPGSAPEGTILYTGATALTAGHWAVVKKQYCSSCVVDPLPELRVFSARGLTVAPSGWTGPRGTPGGTGAPR
ncbi:MAG: hypothetical protein JNK82_07765, partial [Myxococcaceae bacterium]|nr:hypothetical protein [Myxococcaceae bacterium]